MVPDRQKVRTDGRNGRTDAAKTLSLRLRRGIKISVFRVTGLKILGRVGTHVLIFYFWKKYNFMHFERRNENLKKI